MIRALCWKEYREQRSVWLAIAALTFLLVYGLAAALSPGGLATVRQNEELCDRLALVVLGMAVVYGLVCGALLLAGEREVGTLRFLDLLVTRRAPLWKTKVLIGLGLTLGQVVSLTVVGVLAGLMPPGSAPRWGSWVLVLALDAYACGVLGSALCRRVFAGALLGTALFGVSWGIPRILAWRLPALAVFPLATAALAFAASGLIFCWPDRRRTVPRSISAPGVGWRATVRVLLWLTVRESTADLLVVLIAVALACLTAPGWFFLCGLGVVCGTAVFAGELAGGKDSLAGQRVPPGPVWLVKTACWAAVAGLVIVVIFLGARAHPALRYTLRYELFPGYRFDVGMAILVVYGFSAGQLAMLLLRRRLLAMLVATVGGASLIAVWLPSLMLGGLPLWLLLGPPFILLVAGRLAVWPWLADNMRARRSVATFAGCGLLVVLWIVGGFWYRVVSIPDVGEPFDRKPFEAALDAAEASPAGKLIRQGTRELRDEEARVSTRLGLPLLAAIRRYEPPVRGGIMAEDVVPLAESLVPASVASAVGLSGSDPGQGAWLAAAALVLPRVVGDPQEALAAYREQLYQAIEKGWPRADAELSQWLDESFAGKWVNDLRQAAAAPLGLVADPRTERAWNPRAYDYGLAAQAFVGRALQLQARGDDAAALDEIATALGLARQVRNKTPLNYDMTGRSMESLALDGLGHWLARAKPDQGLLRRALHMLQRHEEQTPAFLDNLKAEAYLLRDYLDERLPRQRTWSEQNLAALALQFLWEKARAERLLKVRFGEQWRRATLPSWEQAAKLPRTRPTRSARSDHWEGLVRYWDFASEAVIRDVTRLRAERLRIALALYELEERKAATRLEDLVPRYLAELPLDPYTGRPFGYRVSRGEGIPTVTDELKEGPPLTVAPGQGVVWSTGPDRQDNGGMNAGPPLRLEAADWWSANGADIVFLVPTWPKQ